MTTFVTTHSGAPQNPSTTSQTALGVQRTRLRCPWAVAGPGRASSRRAKLHNSTPAPLVWRAPEGPEGTGELQNAGPGRGAGGRWQGQGGPRDRPLRAAGSCVAISRAGRRPPAHTAARPHRCGGRRRDWWAWLRCPWAAAGPGRASRSITPSRRLACGDLAGGPPPTGTPRSPARQRIQKRPPGTGWAYLSRLWESNPRPIHYE